MEKLSRTIVMVTLVVPLVIYGCSREESWNKLNAEVDALAEKENYSEAIKIAEEALKVAEETFGSEHPNVARSLVKLARLYTIQGDYRTAISLYHRAMKIDKTLVKEDFNAEWTEVTWHQFTSRGMPPQGDFWLPGEYERHLERK